MADIIEIADISLEIEDDEIDLSLENEDEIEMQIDDIVEIQGTNDYNLLYNKPSINSVVLIGNKVSEELGLEPTIIDITEQDIDNIIFGG